jgi:xanthine/uracil permease
MKKLIKKYRIELIGLAIGTLLGWLYWYFIGCSSGTCAITSSPLNSSIYGAIMGVLLSSTFKKEKTNQSETKTTEK